MEGPRLATSILSLTDYASIAVAIAAAAIAFLQWRTMRQQKWIQLFDRRFELYRRLGAVASECAMEGRVTDEAKEAFKEALHLGPILFGSEYEWLFEKLWNAAYWKDGTLKPKSWPKVSESDAAEPHLVTAAWGELRPRLQSKLKRWN